MSHTEYMRKYRAANPEKVRQYQQEYIRRPGPAASRKACLRKSHLKRKFGLTVEQWDRMLEQQGGGCAICKGQPTTSHGFHVDHCHETGKIRGLLCHGCNTTLGAVKESVDTLKAMIEYLES